jgi:AbrB family looped-hinge helix DNA binding protein
MTIATATLSSKGQVVIPKSIRDQLHWESGHELIIETTDSGVLLKSKPADFSKGEKFRFPPRYHSEVFPMTQMTIELDDQIAQDLEARARKEGLNAQEWIERLVRQHVHPQWPESVRALAGAWPDFPTAEELYQGEGRDIPRETW